MDRPLTTEEFKSTYSKVPRLCVDVVISQNNTVVLTKRSIEPYQGYWHIPGGTVYFGETLGEAVNRVAMDELGVDVKVIRVLGLVEEPHMPNNQHAVAVEHLVEVVNGSLSGSWQGEEVRVFDKLPRNIIPSQGNFLNKFLGVEYE